MKFVLTCLLALGAIALGAPPLPIHPNPQQFTLWDGNGALSASAIIVGADAADQDAVRLLKEYVRGSKGSGRINRIIVGERGDAAVAAHLVGLPEKSGAYRMSISASQLVIAGHDGRGTYYGMQTLRQLLAANGDTGALPLADLTDWPDVAFRGVVEGFYGTPWSHEGRLSLIRFFGKHKLDTYIYGPKDDPFHSSPNWRKPYPPEEAARIRELVANCRSNKVDFVWAIHPGKDIKWNDEDLKNVIGKFDAMYALGVRSYAVFFDDISGEGTKADKQAELLNRLHRDFVVPKGDVTPLVMCPTQYNKAWSGGDYLEVLGRTLDPAIHVMWTGNSVVSDLDRPSMEWINTRIRRKAYIWWNYPVSDFVRNHLLLGPAYGNGADIGDSLGGFVSNPMERSEASKVALFGVADYTWNLKTYDPNASWRAGIREVMPGAPEAYEVFSRHNSDLGVNNHGYRRQESVDFAPIAESYLKGLREDSQIDPGPVRMELERIRQAPAGIRSGTENPALLQEIAPWLDAFEQLGAAGVAALDAREALAAGKTDDAWNNLSAALAAIGRLAEIDRTQNRNPYQPGIRTGTLVVAPLVREVIDAVGSRLFAVLSGRPIFRPAGITSSTIRDSLPLMLDGKDDTYFYCKEIQKAGDWYGLDLGGVHEVRRIRIVQGRNDGDHDRVHTGVLETSADGKDWQSVPDISVFQPNTDVILDPPREARQVRVRVTKAGKADGTKNDVWTAIRQFEINPKEAASLRTDLPAFAALPVSASEGVISISPMFEVREFLPGKILGLLFPESLETKRIEVDLKLGNPSKFIVLEGNTDPNTWQAIDAKSEGTNLVAQPNRQYRAVRIRNVSGKTQQVTLSKFAVTMAATAADPAAALTDGLLGTHLTLEENATASVMPGRETSGAYVLLGRGAAAGIKVTALSGQSSRALGSFNGSVIRIPVTPGTTSLTIAAADAGSKVEVHEVLFLSK